MTATVTTWKPSRWELDRLREGKAFRDANPNTTPEGLAEDAALDEWLAIAEAAYAAVGARPEVAPPVEVERPRSSGAGVARADAPTDKQVGFITSLYDRLGRAADDRAMPRTKREASTMIEALKAQVAKVGQATVRPATERQVELLRNLVTERETPIDPEKVEEITPESTPFALASSLIEAWLRLPRRADVRAEHGIRQGYYAHTPDGGTTANHYRITASGQIRIWTAGGEYPYTGKALNEPLTWIKANPREAAELFGRLTETCGRCGRALSDDDSRARGLGPVCATKTEW
jgi:hypothetical protein